MQLQLEMADGWAILPSSLKRCDGIPRFNLNFPAFYARDAGALHLIVHEVGGGGYEMPTRNLIERVLRRGDLFIDVGAHWGFFTLQAATHPAGEIKVVSFEPELMNAVILSENVARNKLADVVSVVCAACGSQYELAPLVTNSTMGHSIRGVGLGSNLVKGPSKWVPVVTLDATLTSLRESTNRRLILKIDAEGFEPEVIAGAREVLRAGRIDLIIWECGHALFSGPKRADMLQMLAFLSTCGFRHFQPPAHHTDGPLSQLNIETFYVGNVFSFAQQVGEEFIRPPA